jgi:hypothetical protein
MMHLDTRWTTCPVQPELCFYIEEVPSQPQETHRIQYVAGLSQGANTVFFPEPRSLDQIQEKLALLGNLLASDAAITLSRLDKSLMHYLPTDADGRSDFVRVMVTIQSDDLHSYRSLFSARVDKRQTDSVLKVKGFIKADQHVQALFNSVYDNPPPSVNPVDVQPGELSALTWTIKGIPVHLMPLMFARLDVLVNPRFDLFKELSQNVQVIISAF